MMQQGGEEVELQSKQNLFSGEDQATGKRRWKVMYASIAGYAMDGKYRERRY